MAPATCAELPKTVLRVAVTRILDYWHVEDQWGSRSYCEAKMEDGSRATLLLTATGWHPTIIVTA